MGATLKKQDSSDEEEQAMQRIMPKNLGKIDHALTKMSKEEI
jgi:hypothetical protein